ncbi:MULTISPECIES: hypothetical protein [unclassified Nocardioides]|uniref:hypothetical protein n=1 Tax=unclassified Nocardioides TaxID=2615069 RepID=UPI003014A189
MSGRTRWRCAGAFVALVVVTACGRGSDAAAVDTCAALERGEVTLAAERSHDITVNDLELDRADLQYQLDGVAQDLAGLAQSSGRNLHGRGWVPDALDRLRTAWRICIRYVEDMPDLDSAAWADLEASMREIAG